MEILPTDPQDNHCDLTKLLKESQKHTEGPYQQSPYPGNHKTGKINFFPLKTPWGVILPYLYVTPPVSSLNRTKETICRVLGWKVEMDIAKHDPRW